MKTLKANRQWDQHSCGKKQAGAILIMFTVGLFALLAVAAMALDGSHLLLSKSRLQNIADASALNGAKILQDGGSLVDARIAAVVIANQNLAFTQNGELKQGIDLSFPDYTSTQVTANIAVEFSISPDPFIPVLDESSKYVRVRIENVGLNNFLADMLGFNKVVRSSAVAGRSTDIECNSKLIPMMVCAEEVEDADGNIIGYEAPPTLELYVMKIGSKQGDPIGPGNFQLLDLGISPSETTLKEALAGGYDANICVNPGDEVETEPGNKVGPVAAGLNMRLGVQTPGQGNMSEETYPPDVNTCQGAMVVPNADGTLPDGASDEAYRFTSYDQSLVDLVDNCDSGELDLSVGVGGRREMEVVIGICDGITNGSNTITVIDTGCFFMTQEVLHTGTEAYVIGEYAATCSGAGNASLDPTLVSDSSTIVLFRDPDSPDS